MKRKFSVKINKTPFTVYQTAEDELTLCYGKYSLSDKKFKSVDEVQNHLEENKWEVITSVVAVTVKEIIEFLESNKNQKTQEKIETK